MPKIGFKKPKKWLSHDSDAERAIISQETTRFFLPAKDPPESNDPDIVIPWAQRAIISFVRMVTPLIDACGLYEYHTDILVVEVYDKYPYAAIFFDLSRSPLSLDPPAVKEEVYQIKEKSDCFHIFRQAALDNLPAGVLERGQDGNMGHLPYFFHPQKPRLHAADDVEEIRRLVS